jgi:LacI family transcriptional regulator, gluconate utilization system Gnt-I transcriptional repressor
MTRYSKVPTLNDVAALAGVSTATVSRFLNNPAVVAGETGERIREAVEQTGYIPNALAGDLASSKSRMVAVETPARAATSLRVGTFE